MPTYRMTVRYGAPRARYHMEDVRAASLAEAMRRGADALPPDVAEGELVEIRRSTEAEQREYGPG